MAAFEATGVSWKPVWHILEPTVTLILANPAHVRAIPGRKSDMNDATWFADLLAYELIRGSFVPPTAIHALRDPTRNPLGRQVAQHTLRLQRVLDDANVKITGLVSDLLGTSGRAILQGLIAGETDPDHLLARTNGLLRADPAPLRDALQGPVRDHHRVLRPWRLTPITALEAAMHTLDARLADLLVPYRRWVARLTTIPGVGDVIAPPSSR